MPGNPKTTTTIETERHDARKWRPPPSPAPAASWCRQS